MIACLAQDGFVYYNFPNLDLDPKTYSSHYRAHSLLRFPGYQASRNTVTISIFVKYKTITPVEKPPTDFEFGTEQSKRVYC